MISEICSATGKNWHFLLQNEAADGTLNAKCKDCGEEGGPSMHMGIVFESGNGVCAPPTKMRVPAHPLFWDRAAEINWFYHYILNNADKVFIHQDTYDLAYL